MLPAHSLPFMVLSLFSSLQHQVDLTSLFVAWLSFSFHVDLEFGQSFLSSPYCFTPCLQVVHPRFQENYRLFHCALLRFWNSRFFCPSFGHLRDGMGRFPFLRSSSSLLWTNQGHSNSLDIQVVLLGPLQILLVWPFHRRLLSLPLFFHLPRVRRMWNLCFRLRFTYLRPLTFLLRLPLRLPLRPWSSNNDLWLPWIH